MSKLERREKIVREDSERQESRSEWSGNARKYINQKLVEDEREMKSERER